MARSTRPGRGFRCRALDAIRAEAAAAKAAGAPYAARMALEARKWEIIRDHLAAHPFTVPTTLVRPAQWQRVLDHVKATMAEPELVDWIIQQMQIAANRAAGIQDLRPRGDGPCYQMLSGYARGRAHKAGAVHGWAEAEDAGRRKARTADPVGSGG